MNNITNTPSVTSAANGLAADSTHLKSETLLLQAEILIARDFDDQMRHLGDQIRFLNGIKKRYREHISKLQTLLTTDANTSRKDGKRFLPLTFTQMSEVFSHLERSHYDLEAMTSETESLLIPDNGDKHRLDEADGENPVVMSKDGFSRASDLQKYFAHGATLTDKEDAMEWARRSPSDDGRLPFYFGHTGNQTDDGQPLFALYVDPLERLTEEMKGHLEIVEYDTERLSDELNRVSAQRKAALDGAHQILTKISEIRSNAIAKMA